MNYQIIALNNDPFSLNGVSFTPREKDVLACMVSGRSFKSTAILLSLSPKTVEAHTRNIFQKMQTNSRQDAINQIETSTEYETLKQHYFRIILKSDFEKCCESLKGKYQGLSIGLLGDGPLYSQIKKDLEALGISITKAPFIKVDGETVSLNGDTSTPKQKAYEVCFLELLKEIAKNAEAASIIDTFLVKHQDIKPTLKKTPLLKKPMKRIYLYGILALLVIGIISTCSLYYGKREVLSNLYLQPKNKLLIRQNDLNALDTMFKRHDDPDQNPVVAITGIGGSGKTTLARLYGKMNAKTLVWEINARTKDSVIESLENLASILGDISPDNYKDYKKIPIGGSHIERQTKLLLFLKKILRDQKDWILIYDNLNKNLLEIQELLFLDRDTCGIGKIIITTRDSNIRASLDYGTIIELHPLRLPEKIELFLKIQSFPIKQKISRKSLENLLENIPPFPLDISIAAHSFSLNISNSSKLSDDNLQKELLVSDHALNYLQPDKATREKIIQKAIQDMVERFPEFKEMLYCLSLIASENIPKKLFENKYGTETVKNLIYYLEKHSFITSKTFIGKHEVFSIHDAIQDSIFQEISKTISSSEQKKFPEVLIDLLIKYIEDLGVTTLHMDDVKMVKLFLRHAEEYLQKKPSIQIQQYAYLLGVIGWNNSLIGRFQKAELLLKKAIDHIKTQAQSLKTAKLWWTLGYTQIFCGKFEDAEKTLKKALSLFERLNIKNTKEYAICLIHSGAAHLYMGNYKIGLSYINRGTLLGNKIQNLEVETVGNGLHGYCLNEMGLYKKAEIVLKEACDFYKSKNLLHHYQWARMHLGVSLLFDKKYEESIRLLEEAKASYEKRLGSNYINIGFCEKNLGLAYAFTKDFSKSQKSLNKAYEIYKKNYGEMNTETATVLAYMGISQFLEGNVETAKSLFLKAQRIFGKSKRYKARIPENYLKKIYLLEKRKA